MAQGSYFDKRKTRGFTRGRRAFLVAALGFAAVASIDPKAIAAESKEPLLTLPVVVSAVYVDGTRVVDDAWIQKQWASVDKLYADFGIRFDRLPAKQIPATSARLETKEDRDALAAYFVDGVVNVFFVKALM